MRLWKLALVSAAGLSLAGCAQIGGTAPQPEETNKVTEQTPQPLPSPTGIPDNGGSVAVKPEPYRPPLDPVPGPGSGAGPVGPNDPFAPGGPNGAQPNPIPAPPAGGGVGGGTYVVQKGDTLYNIAGKVYGAATLHEKNRGANRIYEANRAVIGPNRDRLIVGMKLTVPAKGDDRVAVAPLPAAPVSTKPKR